MPFRYLHKFAVAAVLLLLSACGGAIMPAGLGGAPLPAQRTGTDVAPGDEPPIVYDPETGGYKKGEIPGVTLPPAPEPEMITYTGKSN